MRELILLDCIKAEPKSKLLECLSFLDEDELVSIAWEHNFEIDVNGSEEQMVIELSGHLLNNFKNDLVYLRSFEIDFLKRIQKNPMKKMDDINYVDYMILRKLGYIYLFNPNEHIYPVLPEEFLPMLSELSTSEFELENSHKQKLFSYIRALTNLYGVFEMEQLVKVWNVHNRNKITIDDVKEYIHVMWTRQHYFWFDEDYIISDYFYEDDDEYYDLLDETYDRPYYMPRKNDIDFYSENESDDRSIYFKKLKDFIESRSNLDENRLENMIWEILDSCMLDKPPSEVLDILNENNFDFKDIDEANMFLSLFMNLTNNTRKWVLRGYTPSELFEKHEKPLLKPLPDKPFVVNKKVGRNDPCPCGSGLKYKKCCGK